MLEIKAIGIGGIGCALLPFLCRYLQYSGEPARLTLIDGDRFERGQCGPPGFLQPGQQGRGQVPGTGPGVRGPRLPVGARIRHRGQRGPFDRRGRSGLPDGGQPRLPSPGQPPRRPLWPTSPSFPGATTRRTATSRSTSARGAGISPPPWPAIIPRLPTPGTGIPPPCPARNSWRPAPPNCSSPISWWRP